MKNSEIRLALNKSGCKYWQLADVLGIHPSTLSAKLRHELTDIERNRILKAVERLTAAQEKENQA